MNASRTDRMLVVALVVGLIVIAAINASLWMTAIGDLRKHRAGVVADLAVILENQAAILDALGIEGAERTE